MSTDVNKARKEGHARELDNLCIRYRFKVDNEEVVEWFKFNLKTWLAMSKSDRQKAVKDAIDARSAELSWSRVEETLVDVEEIDI